jgi:anti-sigma B factor antagonist
MVSSRHAGLESRAGGDGSARPETFRVEVRPDRDRVFIAPHGELDLATVGLVGTEIDDLVAREFDRIVIDLRETSFIDSSGVHLLLTCAQRADAHISVIDGPPPVRRVFDLAGIRDLVPFEAAP